MLHWHRYALADAFKARYDRLDVLVNNAGIVTQTRQVSVDGYELMFAVNYLAPFLLTNLLLDVLKASAPARIVNVSSFGYKKGAINFDDPQWERTFEHRQAYYQTLGHGALHPGAGPALGRNRRDRQRAPSRHRQDCAFP
ncbi:MAG: SDR family NAD(P)-dependent oxidoreductase [Caldilineaceae bacterium]